MVNLEIKKRISMLWWYFLFPIGFTQTTSLLATIMNNIFENVLIFPLIEELSKLLTLFISVPVAIVYTLYFSIAEFFQYLLIFSDDFECILFVLVVGRFMCIGLHLLCLYFQYLGFKKYKQTNKKMYILNGFLAATLLHTMWNYKIGPFVFTYLIKFS